MSEHLFFCDNMLGRLAKYLRMLGFDTKYEKEIKDEELLREAKDEDRIVITRDTHLVKRKDAVGICILLTKNDVKSQLIELNNAIPVFAKAAPFTRCSVCNTLLVPITKEQAEKNVPPYVFKTQNQFSYCPACDKVYWPATHIAKLTAFFKEILQKE